MRKRRRLVGVESADNSATVDTAQPTTDSDCRHDVVYNGLCAICGQEVAPATSAGGPGSSFSSTAPSAPTAAAAALYDSFHPSQPHDLPHVDDLAASTPHSSSSSASASSSPQSSSSSSSPTSSSSAASTASHRALVVGTRLLHLTSSAFQSQLESNMHRLFHSRKLMLVLDIDHTLLHTTDDPALSLVDPHLLPPSIHHFALPHPLSPLLPPHRHYLNLRPHLTHFLSSLAPLYDLHIYTMGSRPYAQHILPLLDPSGQLVKGRVVTRSESEGGVKVLERMCACDETMCVIVDDRVDVWSGDKRGSVVRALEYRYFAGREVYDRGGGGGATGNDKRGGGGRSAMYRKAAQAEERKESVTVRKQRYSSEPIGREQSDEERAPKTTTEATGEEVKKDGKRGEETGQKERSEVNRVSAPRMPPAVDSVITIPSEIVIDEEKESPPNSPTSATLPRREVIAIDTDDSDAGAEEQEVVELTREADEVVEVGAKKPKKRVRFHEPLVESIRLIQSTEEGTEEEQKEKQSESAHQKLQESMEADGLERDEGTADDYVGQRMSAAMLDAAVRSGALTEEAAQHYNEWCDSTEQSEHNTSKWQNINRSVYYLLFRCPLLTCCRVMRHNRLPDGSERFSCSHSDDHVDTAVTGVNGPCCVYMDMEGRLTYESVAPPAPHPAADNTAADDTSKRSKKKRIPRKAVQYATTAGPSLLSQMLAAPAASVAWRNDWMAPVASPVLASQVDESKVDNVLLSLLSVLRALHFLFYAHYAITPLTSSDVSFHSSIPSAADSSSSLSSSNSSVSPSVDFALPLPADYTLPSLLSSLKCSVLHGCHVIFSGAFPSAQSAADTEIGKLAIAFGAAVYDLMDASGRGLSSDGDHRITHIVAARDGSDKIKAGVRLRDRRPHVVHLSWLHASAAHFQRADERLFPISLAAQADADEKAGVGGKENARGYVSPALVQHTQTVVTPLQLLRGMQKYRPSVAVLTAMRAVLDEESTAGWSSRAVEEKQELSSSSAASSGGTSSANEGRIKRKRKSVTSSRQSAADSQVSAVEENTDSALNDESGTTAVETTAAQTRGAHDETATNMDGSEVTDTDKLLPGDLDERHMATSL